MEFVYGEETQYNYIETTKNAFFPIIAIGLYRLAFYPQKTHR